jgi:hypothetical protein
MTQAALALDFTAMKHSYGTQTRRGGVFITMTRGAKAKNSDQSLSYNMPAGSPETARFSNFARCGLRASQAERSFNLDRMLLAPCNAPHQYQ